MSLDNRNKKPWEASDSIEDAAKDALGEIFEDPSDDTDGPKDSFFSRWTKFLAIILSFGLLVGGFGAWLAYSSTAQMNRGLSDQEWSDTVQDMHRYFLFGFGLGGVIGISYVIKCLVRKVDP